MKRVVIVLSGIISLSLLFLASACGGDGGDGGDGGGGGDDAFVSKFGLESEVVVDAGLAEALDFAPDGRLFWADHWGGNVFVVSADGEPLPDPVITFDVISGPEWGLTGLALDPDFETNHYIYVYFTELVDPGPPVVARPVVARFTEENNRGLDVKVIVGDLPDTTEEQGFNASGGIEFGPDGFLYFTVGDYDLDSIGPQGKELPQDLGTPIGKMLRVKKEDGSAPPDNPFVDEAEADPRIFAYGFREPFYFTFRPQTGQLYGSDNTGVNCEELNLIENGANYGSPEYGEWPYNDCLALAQTPAIHFFAQEGMEPEDFLSVVGMKGMDFVSGDVYPSLGEGLVVCDLEFMRRLVLGGTNFDKVVAEDPVVNDCGRDIAVSPDGIIYYSNDTEIRRLVPPESPAP